MPRPHDADRRDETPRPRDPYLPDDVTPKDLAPAARNELKTLSKENAERVARHLAMAARLIDVDPEAAHQHALAASRHAGRIPVARETVGITAYRIGDYVLALRELRTYRRLSGREDEIALMVDSERGVGHPERALELGRSVDRSTLPPAVRAHLAIAMSGAWLDQHDAARALQELEIPEADPDRAFAWSPDLFAARAVVLDELGRDGEAAMWRRRADVAAQALDEASGAGGDEVVEVEDALDDTVEDPGEPDQQQPATTGEPDTVGTSVASEAEDADAGSVRPDVDGTAEAGTPTETDGASEGDADTVATDDGMSDATPADPSSEDD